jgi:hypothetical protein
MTIGLDSQNLESYVPVYDAIPDKWEDARAFVVEQFKKHGNAINAREIGFFLDQELLSGKSFIPGLNIVTDGGSTQQFRTILRIVVDFGPLPNAGVKTVPHGITFDANFTLIQLWASATDPTNLTAIPIPFVSSTIAPVQIFINATDIVITTTSNLSTYTRCFVFIEYIQEL